MNRVTQLHQRAAIGIITALPKEFSAVKIMLQSPADWLAPGEGAGRRYVLGEISAANSGTHAVVLALLTDVGTNSAAVSANNLLHHFPSVRHIIMCGIAGGIPSHASPEDSVRLGDIVVSDRKGVVNYDFIKQTPDEIREIHPPPLPGAELLEAVRFLEAARIDGHRPWEKFLELSRNLEDAIRPRDNLGADGMVIEYHHDSRRKQGLPRLFYSPIASANRLLKDARFRDELQRRFQVKAVEMEGSGIADATWLGGRAGYLVVRGICDFCDMHKGDLWQGYAAVAAAAYVRALLESMPAMPVVNGAHAESTPLLNQSLSPGDRRPSSPPISPSNATSNQPQDAQAPSLPLVAAQATAEPVQAKPVSSRRSATGCMTAALLLTLGAIGVTVSADSPEGSKDRRSILKSLTDTLNNTPPPSLLAPVPPAPSMRTSSEGISGLRRLHSVRALQDSENGKTLSQMPAGTLGYIEQPLSPEHLPQARVRNTPALGPVEVHKLNNGALLIVGFARDSETRSLLQGGRSRLTLFRAASTQARTAIAIPTAWIRAVSLTAQGEIMLDLSSSPK